MSEKYNLPKWTQIKQIMWTVLYQMPKIMPNLPKLFQRVKNWTFLNLFNKLSLTMIQNHTDYKENILHEHNGKKYTWKILTNWIQIRATIYKKNVTSGLHEVYSRNASLL